jgi:hypothetical protein
LNSASCGAAMAALMTACPGGLPGLQRAGPSTPLDERY